MWNELGDTGKAEWCEEHGFPAPKSPGKKKKSQPGSLQPRRHPLRMRRKRRTRERRATEKDISSQMMSNKPKAKSKNKKQKSVYKHHFEGIMCYSITEIHRSNFDQVTWLKIECEIQVGLYIDSEFKMSLNPEAPSFFPKEKKPIGYAISPGICLSCFSLQVPLHR